MTLMAEKKYHNRSDSAEAIGIIWTFQSAIAGLTQGTDNINRIGQKIRVHSIEWYLQCNPLTTTIDRSGANAKFIIYHNTAAGGALPTGAAIFDADNMFELRNINQTNKIRILRSKTCTCVITAYTSADAAAAGPPMMLHFKIYPKKVVEFSSNGSSQAVLLKDDYGIGYCAEAADSMSITQLRSKVIFSDA